MNLRFWESNHWKMLNMHVLYEHKDAISVLQRAANMIPAHDSPLAALAFDASGTKLATASEKVCVFKSFPSLKVSPSILVFSFAIL